MSTKQELLHFWKSKNIVTNENILKAFDEIPRDLFIPEDLQHEAYHDHPLPTLRKQSISQPTTIMVMLQELQLEDGHKVFEIGSGVGYQAAMMANIVGNKGKVVTTEVIPELVASSRQNLQKLAITNCTVLEADGSNGFPEDAPFDRIIITAACPSIPPPLLKQLKEGGIIVAPVGDLDNQTMIKGTKRQDGLDLEFLGPFRFVPLKGKYGFKDY